jgi:hypothetical protein
VEVQPFDQFEYMVLIRRVANTDFEPGGLGLPWSLNVADYSQFAGQMVTS